MCLHTSYESAIDHLNLNSDAVKLLSLPDRGANPLSLGPHQMTDHSRSRLLCCSNGLDKGQLFCAVHHHWDSSGVHLWGSHRSAPGLESSIPASGALSWRGVFLGRGVADSKACCYHSFMLTWRKIQQLALYKIILFKEIMILNDSKHQMPRSRCIA